jgi:TldD protein
MEIPESYRLSPEDARSVLEKALARGGAFAELFLEYSLQTRLTLTEGRLRHLVEGVEAGLGVRVIAGTQVGYAYTESMDRHDLLRAAETASSIAAGPRKINVQPVSPRRATALFTVKDPPFARPLPLKIELVTRADAAARGLDGSISEVTVRYLETRRHIEIINSEGLWLTDDQDITQVAVGAVAVKNGLRCSGYHTAGGRIDFGEFTTRFTPEHIAGEAAGQAVSQLSAAEPPSGEMPVIIAAGYGGTMVHEAVGHGFEGDFIRRGTSLYTGKVGQKVASDVVTIVDDGSLPHLRGSYNIDDEGIPGQRTVLIENGVLQGYLHDRISAAALEMSPTGNGRRESYQHYPIPRMTNTFIDQGTSDPAEMLRSVKKGFFARKIGGGQVDITSGNFVFSVTEGVLIEDGRLTTPVRGASLIGNGPDIMTRVTMVGNDLEVISAGTCGKGQLVPVGDGMPTVLVSLMTVGGR